MYYYQIFLTSAPDLFTWNSRENLPVGARVLVNLLNRKRIGIIISKTSEQPTFKTKPILEILNKNFIQEKYISLYQKISRENFCSLNKIISSAIPAPYFTKKIPTSNQQFVILNKNTENLLASNQIKGKKQIEAIKLLLENNGQISRENFRKTIPLSTEKNLVNKNLITIQNRELTNPKKQQKLARKQYKLTDEQNFALAEIKKSELPILLWGATGSGKTEVYKTLCEKLKSKINTKTGLEAQILFILPEISLTPQIIKEFREIFGSRIAIWHSQMTPNQKTQEFARISTGEAQILIGARSACLIPFKNLQLIVVDEEHEWTMKNEQNPKFWVHNVVEKIAEFFDAKLVFGTATPKLESIYKCKTKQWNLVEMKSKVLKTLPPEVQIVDMRIAVKKDAFPLSNELKTEISRILERKKQVIILLNRRGFHGSTLCRACGKTINCPHCSMPMKLHKKFNTEKLVCHVCGTMKNFAKICPECNSKDLLFQNAGTEQIETELQKYFPSARILRADRDTVKKKDDFEKIYIKFREKKADILLGTQMIAKGLDFENVELVGIALADIGLSLPDYSAEERIWQLATQVAGRAGRRHTRGKLIIQTFRPKEKIWQYIKNEKPTEFIDENLKIREKFELPPFAIFAKIKISNKNLVQTIAKAKEVYNLIKTQNLVSLPKNNFEISMAPAFFPRTHDKYHYHIFIKSKTNSARENSRQILIDFLKSINFPFPINIDIEPASLL